MYQFKGMEDTIAAIATPTGYGGLGIIRLSGAQSLLIADKIFRSKTGGKPSSFKTFTVHYGMIFRLSSDSSEEALDEVLLTVMRGPQSYTREDVVEISCHGGVVAQRAVLQLAIDHGCRLAEPGEFTKRAFLNGRIDLTQAEAVLDMIQAKTDAFLRVSAGQLKGDLSRRLEEIRSDLMQVYTSIEALVNFPEDQTDSKHVSQLNDILHATIKTIDDLLVSSEHGRILREGIKIVICGKPNVGKSSLLNSLLKHPRAIVADIAGTTRDTIEETAQIQGIPFQLIDTAGILEPRDVIEEEAVRRSRQAIETADLILLIFEANQPLTEQDYGLMDGLKTRNVILVFNKTDLPSKINESDIKKNFPKQKLIRISVTKNIGLKEMEQSIVDNIWHGSVVQPEAVMLTNIRHIHSLKECRQFIEDAVIDLKKEISLEFISENIKLALNSLDAITGRNVDEDLLEVIFSKFCIGK